MRSLWMLGIVLVLVSCSVKHSEQLIKISGRTMGTTYHISYFPFTPGASPASEVKPHVDKILQHVNQLMSTYISTSELSRFNKWKSTKPFKVEKELLKVIMQAQHIAEISQGAFDITVGPAVNAWGFGPTKIEHILSSQEILQMRSYVGYHHLAVDATNKTVAKGDPRMYVDLSAIAKGYGVDVVADYFSSIQAKAYMVEIGGELKVKGLKYGKKWQIGITAPDDITQGPELILPLTDQAMATSGDYRNYFVKNGKRYSHTIDPRTLSPITHNLASVTVLDKSCARADALATTLMVMGVKKGMKFANIHHIPAFFIYREQDRFRHKKTDYFTLSGK